MRITFELVENAYQFITPLKERAVSLRGMIFALQLYYYRIQN